MPSGACGIQMISSTRKLSPCQRATGSMPSPRKSSLTAQIDEARLFGLEGRAGHASFRLLHVLEFRDGKISRENVWADTAAILAQTKEKERRRV